MAAKIENLEKVDPTISYKKIHKKMTDKYNKFQKEQAAELQKFLQNKYYGEGSKDLIEKTRIALRLTGRELNEKIVSFSQKPLQLPPKTEKISFKNNVMKFYSKKKAEESKNASKIDIEFKLKEMKTALKRFEKAKTNNKEWKKYKNYKDFESNLISLENSYNDVFKKSFGRKKRVINFEEDRNIEEFVKTLDKLYFEYIKPFSESEPLLTGDTFEYSMALIFLDTSNKGEKEVRKAIRNELKKSVKGKNPIISNNITIKPEESKGLQFEKEDFEGIENSIEIKLDNGSSIEVKPNIKPINLSSKGLQGKVDVSFTYLFTNMDAPIDLNLSLKNWQSLEGEYSEIKIYNLARTLAIMTSEKDLHSYIYNLGHKTEIDNWHKVAKASMIGFGLMGIYQNESSADMLIINNRANSEIVVLPFGVVADKLEDIVGKKEGYEGYKEETINKDLVKIFKTSILEKAKIFSGQEYLRKISVQLRYKKLFNEYAINKSNNPNSKLTK